MNEVLMHYGVKGQKWGKHKPRMRTWTAKRSATRVSDLPEETKEKLLKRVRQARQVGAKDEESGIPGMTRTVEAKRAELSPEEMKKFREKALSGSGYANEESGIPGMTRTVVEAKRAELSPEEMKKFREKALSGSGYANEESGIPGMTRTVVEAKRAELSPEELEMLRKKAGIKPVEPKKAVTMSDSSEDFLAHHGIIGMKWGIRRFQKKDGSLTPEGAERYSEDHTGSAGSYSKSETSSEGHTGSSGSYSKSGLSQEELAARSARRKDIAKKVAIGIGITAAVVGAAYVGHQMGMKAGEMNAVNSDAAKDLVAGLSNEPTVPLLPPPSGKPLVGNVTTTVKTESSQPQAVKETAKPAETKPVPHEDHTKAHNRKDVSEYSTKELAEITARLGLEKKYASLTTPNVVSGRQKASNILRGLSGAISATTPMIAIARRNNPNGGASKVADAVGMIGGMAGAAASVLDLMEKIKS